MPNFIRLPEDERSALNEPITVYGYQLRRVRNTDYYGFNFMGREYFIREADRNSVAENLLDFNEYFTKVDDAGITEICCDDETIAQYRAMRREELRRAVLKFPFDWDANLYARCSEEADCAECTKAFQGKCQHLPQSLARRGNEIDSFPALSRVMQRADVRGDVDFLNSDSSLWHFHPVGFYKHFHRMMPFNERVADLMNVQDMVIAHEAMQRGSRGMYGRETYRNTTFCNHAVFLTITVLDGNFRQFIGYPDIHSRITSPYNVNHLVRGTAFWERNWDFDNRHRRSNLWCEILREQARNSQNTGIHRIHDPAEAQEMANRGYVVIGSWMNMTRHGSPHFATVRPHFGTYEPALGPYLANVGWYNGTFFTTQREAFEERSPVEWYYNRNQQFRKDFTIWRNRLG